METLHSETSKQRGHATSPGPLMQRRLDPSTRRRGYILIMFTLCLSFLLGVIGLGVDIGRMYVVKSETQSFVDAAALNAAVQLVLNPGAFTAARNAAAQTPKKWEFGTNAFTGVVTTFGTNPDDLSTFIPSPPDSLKETYTFAQVTARVNLPLYLLPVVVGATRSSIAAMAVAGQQATTALAGGEMPFSPFSRKNFSPDDPNDPFGYKIGNTYTLRWGAKGGGAYSDCDNGGDMASLASSTALGGDFRGYCCTGSGATDFAREIALGGGTVAVNVGDPFAPLMVTGQKSVIEDAIVPYIGYDKDRISLTYAQYKAAGNGNGKRLIIVPVNGQGPGGWTVVGFAGFFLLTSDSYKKVPAGKASWCAEYVGHEVQGVPLAPGAGFGIYHMKIYR